MSPSFRLLPVAIVLVLWLSGASAGERIPPRTIWLPHQGYRTQVTFSPDGKILATGGQDNHIRLWQADSGKLILSIVAHRAPAGISRLVFFPNGKTLASAGWAGDGTVKLWEAATGKERRLVGDNRDGGIAFLAVSPNGKLLAWGNGGKIHLHDVTKDREARLVYIPFAIDSSAFSPDGRILASANGGGTVRLWEVASGKPRLDLPAEQTTATGSQAVAFAPDGRTLATAGDKVCLWDLASGKLKATLGAAGEPAFCIAFSPNGCRLAAGTYKALHLWEVATGKEVRRWDQWARSVAFSPDSKRLAFGSGDGAAIVDLE